MNFAVVGDWRYVEALRSRVEAKALVSVVE